MTQLQVRAGCISCLVCVCVCVCVSRVIIQSDDGNDDDVRTDRTTMIIFSMWYIIHGGV